MLVLLQCQLLVTASLECIHSIKLPKDKQSLLGMNQKKLDLVLTVFHSHLLKVIEWSNICLPMTSRLFSDGKHVHSSEPVVLDILS